ncbi:MAG: sigma-70 family RNA polymerase sigma factor [Lewinellaceae bacterium]|nr:sigma-70 family RNA polymerase sigma factor [Lewinellaceae bacterium]
MEDDAQLIRALQGGDSEYDRAVKQLCEDKSLQDSVSALVRRMGGTETDAEDTFWQGIEILIFNIGRGRFKGQSTLKTYLLAICRNVFLKQRKPVFPVEAEELAGLAPSVLSPEDLQIRQDQKGQFVALYQVLAQKVGDRCKKIFEMLKRGASMQALAEELGHEKAQSAQNAAYRCREKLRQLILDDSTLKKQIAELL